MNMNPFMCVYRQIWMYVCMYVFRECYGPSQRTCISLLVQASFSLVHLWRDDANYVGIIDLATVGNVYDVFD